MGICPRGERGGGHLNAYPGGLEGDGTRHKRVQGCVCVWNKSVLGGGGGGGVRHNKCMSYIYCPGGGGGGGGGGR